MHRNNLQNKQVKQGKSFQKFSLRQRICWCSKLLIIKSKMYIFEISSPYFLLSRIILAYWQRSLLPLFTRIRVKVDFALPLIKKMSNIILPSEISSIIFAILFAQFPLWVGLISDQNTITNLLFLFLLGWNS